MWEYRAGEYTVILESLILWAAVTSELADNLFEAGQDILRSRDLGFNSLDTAPRHRAVSDRPVTMACCGKDNEEKETGVRHTSTRAPGTIHEPAFEPRRPTILESITTKPGNRGGGTGIQDRSRRRHGARPPSIEPRARRGHPRANLASGSGRFGAVPRRARGPRASVVPAVDPTTAQGVNNGGVANRARFSPDSTTRR